ncbi:MAG: c-type cytochrome [Halieaceae bacterium]|jgi:cytochrome c5|nr:c-type cytochrome [Halieaceae bacterium]
MTKSLKSLVILLAAALSITAFAKTEEQRAAITERIKPHGSVCVAGDTSCGAMTAVAAGGDSVRSGEEVYNAACVACHASGAAGAPKLGDVAAWSDRISKGREVLHDSGLNGVAGTGMIARGGCMNCSDDEIIAAVDYMVDNSQ